MIHQGTFDHERSWVHVLAFWLLLVRLGKQILLILRDLDCMVFLHGVQV